jgi:tripartite motif-containing protein 71
VHTVSFRAIVSRAITVIGFILCAFGPVSGSHASMVYAASAHSCVTSLESIASDAIHHRLYETWQGLDLIEVVSLDGRHLGGWHPGEQNRRLAHPDFVAVAPSGTVYLTDSVHDTVGMLSHTGRVLRVWGGKGRAPGRFNDPQGIAVDTRGNVYVADRGNARVEKFSRRGRVLAVWRAAKTRLFFEPSVVAVDRAGRVYVADGQDNWVYRLSSSGKPLARLGSFTNPTQGEFRGPQGIAVDRAGNIYVSSYNWITKLSPRGTLLARWGSLRGGSRPGTFLGPTALATDGRSLYVNDFGNVRIQRLTLWGKPLDQWSCD